MAEIFTERKRYKIDHTRFGGIIYSSDYNTEYSGKSKINSSFIAQRILTDEKFDEQCKRNLELKQSRN